MSSDHHPESPHPPDETGRTPENPERPKLVQFTELARCGNEVWIQCGGQLYRLQQTRQGKLILTK